MKPIITLILSFNLSVVGLSQDFSSINNFTGSWEDNTSWDGGLAPSLNISGALQIEIDGNISTSSNLSIGASSNLYINDTLFVDGDLNLQDNATFDVLSGGVLIVSGSLNIINTAMI